MSKLKLKNGTPVGEEHLCRRCSHGQYTTGYRESDLLVICGNTDPARVVPFVVNECSAFWDKHRPDWEQMRKLALDFADPRLKPTPGFRQSGFNRVPMLVPDDDESDEAARARSRLTLIR